MIEDRKKIPHLPDTEKAVLSVLFQRLKNWDEVAIDVEMFHLNHHRYLFEILKEEGGHIDLNTFTEKLIGAGKLNDVGGAAILSEIYTAKTDSRLLEQDVARLREYSARRLQVASCCVAVEKAMREGEDYLSAIGEPMTAIMERATSTSSERDKKEVIQGIMQQFADVIAGKQSPYGWDVSLPTLSRAIRGFTTPRYAVLSAYPSGGKTLMAIQFLIDFAKQDVPCLFFGAEMPTDLVMKRAIVTNAKIDPEALYDPVTFAVRDGNQRPTKDHLEKIRTSCAEIKSLPIYFEEATAPEIGEVVTVIRRAVKRYGVKAVAIDYLQLLKDSSTKGNQEQEVSRISHALQSIAKELDLFILVLSQQNKEGGTKYATTTTEDVDYHFSIEQIMDKASEDFKKVVALWIEKDRHTSRSGYKIPIEKRENRLYFEEIPFQRK